MTNGLTGIERLDPRLDALVPSEIALEVLADFGSWQGPHWLEGPAWDWRNGCLLFSDVKANAIYRWQRGGDVRLFMQPSGYTGESPFQGEEPGSNGLACDGQGRLLICEHGDRRLRRLEADGSKTVLAERYEGRRLNSPNDLVCRSDGSIYFTDPAYGRPRQFDDPGRELPFCGVYRIATDGELTLLLDQLRAPNGIAFSPDEKTLYLTDSHRSRTAWFAYAVEDDGTLGTGQVLLDVTDVPRYGGCDGLAVDRLGNLYGAAREAVYIFADDGTHLGTIPMGSITTNVAWGEDGSTLFVTTERRLLALRLNTRGMGF